MSSIDFNAGSPIQPSQAPTPDEVKKKGKQLAEAFRDIIEQSEHVIVSAAQKATPLPFITPASVDEATKTTVLTPPKEYVQAVKKFYDQNKEAINEMLGRIPNLPVDFRNTLAKGFASDDADFQSNVSVMLTAILITKISEEQGEVSARMGIIGGNTAVDLNKEQIASAVSQQQAGLQQASSTQNTAQGEITSGIISMAVGGVSAIASAAGGIMSSFGTSAKALEEGVGALSKSGVSEATLVAGDAAKTTGQATATAAAKGAAGSAESEAADDAAAAAAKAGKPSKTPDAWKKLVKDQGGPDKLNEADTKALKSDLQIYKSNIAFYQKLGQAGKAAEWIGQTVSQIGGGAASKARGDAQVLAAADQTQAAGSTMTSQTQQASASMLQAYQSSATDLAKTSIENAAGNVQTLGAVQTASTRALQG